MLNKIREYRWELWLFFGVPVVSRLVELAIWAIFSPEYDSGDRQYYVWLHLPRNVAVLSVLAVSYPWIRRLKRPLLRLLWQHSLLAITIGMALSLVIVNLLYDEGLSLIQQGLMGALVAGTSSPMQLAILMWFSRRASRGGFNYALAFIGITAFPHLAGILEVGNWSLGYYIGGLIFRAMLALMVVRVLHRADMGGGVNGRAITTLFSAALLGHASSYLLAPLSEWLLVIFYNALFVVLYYGVAVGLAYLVRARNIDPDFIQVDQPPTDEGPKPPADDEDHAFVGLYSNPGNTEKL